MTRASAGIVLIVTSLLACGGDGTTPDPQLPPLVDAEIVVTGLSSPVYLTAPPGDTSRLFVVERGGLVRIVRDDAVLPTPFIDLSGEADGGGEQEQGLLSMAFHPEYDTNGYFFVYYTDDQDSTQVVRYTVSAGDPDVADPGSALHILSVGQPDTNHNGGLLTFGPDGMLHIGLGDGGGAGDPDHNGQDPSTLLGSLLRIDVDSGSPYTIPVDNPPVAHQSARPETWAFGLRNPWRYSFDRVTGDLYIADVGQGRIEEIDFQPATSIGGENYGWRTTEGSACYAPSSGCDMTGLTLPIHEYPHADGCSVTGGYVYRGAAIPDAVGRYFYADYCSTWVRSFEVVGGVATDHRDHESELGPISSISSFGEDAEGELYIVSLGAGTVYRLIAP